MRPPANLKNKPSWGHSMCRESDAGVLSLGGVRLHDTPVCLMVYVKPSRNMCMAPANSAAEDAPPVDAARDELQAVVPEATATLQDLLAAEDDRVQIRAAEAILDRAGVTKAT